jgi:hypothetical protein
MNAVWFSQPGPSLFKTALCFFGGHQWEEISAFKADLSGARSDEETCTRCAAIRWRYAEVDAPPPPSPPRS